MCKGSEKGSCSLFQDFCPSIRLKRHFIPAYFISRIIWCQLIGILNNELERTWREAAVICVMYYISICLKGLRKATKNLSQDSRSPDT
jgi:steroid 5-alpha reductase family enzyme